MKYVVTSISPIEMAICHHGGVLATMRTYIRMGAKNGTIESHSAIPLSGVRMTFVSRMMGMMSGMVTKNCHCCASCSEFTIAPSAAYKLLYSMNPSRKNTGRNTSTTMRLA